MCGNASCAKVLTFVWFRILATLVSCKVDLVFLRVARKMQARHD